MPSDRDIERMKEVVDELKQLRCRVDEAEHQLLRESHKVEISQKKLWTQFYKSFDELLEGNHICDSMRYRNFLAAEDLIKPAAVDAIGIHASLQAAKIEDPARREKYIEAGGRRFKDEGVPWSEQQAKKMRKEIAGQPPRDSRINGKIDREQQLKEENIRLRREIQALKREIKEKDQEIAKLRSAITKKKSESRRAA